MLLQSVGSKQIVYVNNYLTDYMSVAEEFGMIDNGELASYVVKSDEPYINSFGIERPSIRLNGRTVDVHVVDDTVAATESTAGALSVALNTFPVNSRLTLNGYPFVSRFYWSASNRHCIYDSVKRCFSVRTYGRKDLKGIYNLMVHLGDNNGKLYEPVIARYVYTSYQMPKHRQLVGYFDLGEYFSVIRDRRYEDMFMTMGRSNSLSYVELKTSAPIVKVTNVVDNCAMLTLQNIEGSYDAKKLNEFKPHVILTRRPLVIKTMKFPWTKVHFDKVDVFMTPIMSLSDAWESLEGGINLLSLPTGKTKNLRF